MSLAASKPETLYQQEVRNASAAWRKAGYPDIESDLGQKLFHSALMTGRSDLIEQLLAGGPVMRKMLPLPKGGRKQPLRVLRTFRQFHARFDEELFSSFQGEDGWLARRITADRVEVWTSKHGWLFDGAGRLLNEARPPRRSGTGRQWYGAFLPDGRWVTTDLDELDGTLTFFSAKGAFQRALFCEQLAFSNGEPHSANLLGWARGDKDGTGWIVNVGSEDGWATVWVGPTGPARILDGAERWRLCYPRALGPRGWFINMSVPDDGAHGWLSRSEAGHGPRVGFPTYQVTGTSPELKFGARKSDPNGDLDPPYIVPNGSYVFGFWPGSQNFFIVSDGNNITDLTFLGDSHAKLKDYEPSGVQTRKYFRSFGDGAPEPIIDKTWLFDAHGTLMAWIRARRIGDAADGTGMLFRITADSRIVTLQPNLKVQAVRRMVWKDGSTADAVALWDDLHMGLFIRNEHLVMARWGGLRRSPL